MKHKKILKAVAALAVLAAGCTGNEFEEITGLDLARCLQPQNLSAKVDVATGDVVTFGWDVNKDAESYNLVVYTDEAMTQEALKEVVAAADVPYTVRLAADAKYWFKVQALSGKRDPSVWAVYDGSCRTYAVKDNLFLEVADRTATSLSLVWSSDASDYQEVTHITAVPVKGGQEVELTLGASEASSAAATVTGLEASTEYQVTLFYLSASRGAVDTWTRAEQGSATRVSTSEELVTLLTAGDNIYLSLAGSPYEISNVMPAGSVSLVGETGADGSRPVVVGKVELTDALAAGSSLYFEGIRFDGNGANSRIIEHTGGALDVESIRLVNCEITNYQAGLFYGNNASVIKVGTFTFDSCDIYGIPGSGGDAVDIRQTTEIGTLAFVNNTIYDGIRTMFRVDAKDDIKIGTLDFEGNTVKAIATMDDGNNRGFFALRVATDLTLKKNLFLYEDGGKTGDDTDRAQLFQVNAATVVPTLDASDNYSFASGKDFFNKVSAAAAGFTELEADPCYNAKGNFFQLSHTDLISKKVGASKWWISYVEKEEDLTQEALSGAHTWNLQDASLFAGEVKNARVRDGLLLVGTEATPLNADGGIHFLGASVLTRKGVPTEGYIAFKVDAPGSVDLLVADPDGTGSSVVVALQDDKGFAVKGGAVASASNGGVQKVVVNSVSGEGTVYLYATGAISLTKLAWSTDVTAGNKALAAPKPVVEPVTLTEGDETAVTVTWDAVPNAASYVVVFNKRAADPQTECTFTVDAGTIAGLKAGLYNFTVTAYPAADDIYYTASEPGAAAIAIQPKGQGGEAVKVTLTWDFSDADWQAAFATYGAANTDITNWDLTLDGLTFYSAAKSKYNTTFIQMGGKGSTSDRYLKFTAPEQGTLKVWASNTGNSEDLTRLVTVNVGGDEQSLPGGYASGGGAVETEFSVPAGEVYIYASGNALRFYRVFYTNQ